MTLALMDAFIAHPESPDYKLIMDNFYAWLSKAKYTAGDKVFDVGMTCYTAILECAKGSDPLRSGQKGEFDCGNGGLMRILPVLFYLNSRYGDSFIECPEAVEVIENITGLTHAHPRCLIASGIYLSIAEKILEGKSKEEAVYQGFDMAKAFYTERSNYDEYLKEFLSITEDDFKETGRDEMSGRTYVVDTLKAAIWAFIGTTSYKECIFKGINLGNDTDTVAAVAGGLAGLYYGVGGDEGIPLEYLACLRKRDYILDLCTEFAAALNK